MPNTTFCSSLLLGEISSLIYYNGDFYAANFNNLSGQVSTAGSIVKINSNGVASIFSPVFSGRKYAGLMYSSVQNAFLVTDFANSIVYKVDITSGTTSVFIDLGNIPGKTNYYLNPAGLISNGAGEVLVVNTAGFFPGISKINESTGTWIQRWTSEAFVGIPNYIAYDPITTNYWVTDISNNAVQTFVQNAGYGVYNGSPILTTGGPESIIIYNNNIFLTNFTNNVVTQYNINGTLLSNSYSTGGKATRGGGLVFNAAGNFFVANNQASTTNGTILQLTENIICFKEGTKILCRLPNGAEGYRTIERLQKRDLVKTLNSGYQPIYAIGYKEIYHPAKEERIKDQLYKCSKDKYNEIFEDLIVTGCHSILVDSFASKEQREKTIEINGDTFVTDNRYRLPACADDRAEVYEIPGSYKIYHFALEHDDYYVNYGVYANGLLVESCSKRNLLQLSNMKFLE